MNRGKQRGVAARALAPQEELSVVGGRAGRDACVDDRPPSGKPEPDLPPGLMLIEAREARGLSLDDLVRATKIPGATLAAIESADVPRLPATIYTRGFIKAYAREVGLDPDQTADEYVARLTGIDPRPEAAPPPEDLHARSSDALGAHGFRGSSWHHLGWLATAAALGLAGALAAGWLRDPAADAAPPSSAAGAPDGAVVVDTAGGVRLAEALAPSAEPTALFHVEIVPQGPCWLVATVDGERVIARLLQSGERQTLAIAEEALLRVGDPGALAISINGRSARTLGLSGQPVNVRITRQNFHEFISS